MDQIGGAAEQWEAAAQRYKAARESRKYKADYRVKVSPRERECIELLQNFFSPTNSGWQAARRLLKFSGKKIELKVIKQGYKTIEYVLTHEGFRRIVHPEWPFNLERHGVVSSPLTFQSVAALLADGMAVEPAECVFDRKIIQKIEEIVESSRLL